MLCPENTLGVSFPTVDSAMDLMTWWKLALCILLCTVCCGWMLDCTISYQESDVYVAICISTITFPCLSSIAGSTVLECLFINCTYKRIYYLFIFC